ncbi:MAG: asparagine synthase (glutamine-hydrolyzing) [Cyclobacteriaceae bacterium]|nr:asparagine synthase (glutamine-hydrolyzing) [Cyclobacteriaceae bacterium]
MCGIFGYTNFKNTELEKARRALDQLTHRGPDQWSDYFDEKVYLGHRRLSIIDLSENGRQPMFNNDKSVVITINGEIYNYLELKKLLIDKYTFKSNSDSEVILNGYLEWGIDGLLERIDGMFAIVVYDNRKEKIFLVRDRVGIKPLYYTTANNQVTWSSELKSINSFHDSLEIDYTAVYDFLTYQYIPAPKSLYKNCFKLEPAHYIEIDANGKLSKTKYWQLDPTEKNGDVETARQIIFDKVTASVKEQLVADVPVGFFLSGGMDSSAVVASASLVAKELNTFSIGFEGKGASELKFAKMVAKKCNTNHFEKYLSGDKVNNDFHKILEWYDEPYADLSCFPTYLVSKFAKEKVTVVLTGDGGDEVFGGYKWYERFKILDRYSFRKYQRLKRPIMRVVSLFKNSTLKKYTRMLFLDEYELYVKLLGGYLKEDKIEFKQKWNIPADYDDYWYIRKYYKANLPVYTRLQFLDFHTYLPDDILTKVDRVSMALALECRVPLLSRNIIEYSFSLSEKVRFHKYGLKGIFKYSFDSILPAEIIKRSKKGFSIPVRILKTKVITLHENRFMRILKEVFEIIK